MARLRRVRDGAGDSGMCFESIEWNDDGTFKKIKSRKKPIVGCSVRVGSVTARSYSTQDYWLTTPVTEILEKKPKEGYYKFKTGNSEYELWL